MTFTALVFGSSHDRARSRWCVWFFDIERNEVVPLAEYREKMKSEHAASELADAAASLDDATVADRILNSGRPEVALLTAEMAERCTKVAKEALAAWEPAMSGQAASVRSTLDDTVHVVERPAQR